MPKLYLGPGLSSRVHQALCRRLEQFMAANAEGPAPREVQEFPRTENPPLTANLDGTETEVDKGDEHGSHPPEEADKSPADKDERDDDDRSRSPRRIPEVSAQSTTELLAATTSMAVGITSMVGALKDSTNKLEILIQQSQNLQRDLCKSLEVVSGAINNMARGIESLSGGVTYNTSRVGAMVGEYTKLRKHLEWTLDVSMKEVLKDNAKGREERDQAQKEVMDQLFESMDKLQANLQKIAVRIENAPVAREGTTGFDPPQPPTGHLGSPSATPMTPGHGMMFGSGILPHQWSRQHALQMEVKDLKQPCQVVEESSGRIRAVSPTARHDPATGTAAFSPLGYVQVKGTNEYRRVYP